MKNISKRFLGAGLAAFLLAGCSPMYFHNAGVPATTTIAEEGEFHHVAALSFVEISEPVNLAEACPGGWSTVKTHKTEVDGIISFFIGTFYAPWHVAVAC